MIAYRKRLSRGTSAMTIVMGLLLGDGYGIEPVVLESRMLVQPALFDPAVSPTLSESEHRPLDQSDTEPAPFEGLGLTTASWVPDQAPTGSSLPPRGVETPRGPRCGRYAEDGCQRSGRPDCISRFATCSVTTDHAVGYVGGGSALFGDQRCPEEGTFGLDYSGHWFSRKVWLLWNHGRKHQGGAGAYASDGPKILPE